MSTTGKKPRLSEVAKLAEVSPGLVSRVLNNDPTLRVRQATRDRVLAAVEMLQYTPHASARALRSSHTGLLGFALHHVNDPIYAELVSAAQSAAAESDYLIVMLNADELTGRSDAFRQLVRGRRVDGLLIQDGFISGGLALHDVATALPTLVFNADPAPGIRSVRFDDVRAATMAVEHLIGLGHERIAFVGADGGASDRRHAGYLQAMGAARLQPLPVIHGGWDADEARRAVQDYYAAGGSATALIVATSTSALGAHSGIIAAGLRIPHDVSVMSIHDAWFAPHLNPPLTVAALPLAEAGSLAVELLLEQIRSPESGETVVSDPPAHIVERGSTGSPPQSLPDRPHGSR